MTPESRSVVLASLAEVEVRESGVGDGSYTIRGHAAVYDKLSHNLGGFQEKIAPGAFDRALAANPDVLAVWDHDTSYTLARTRNGTLELRTDPYGLHAWMRVAPTSYAADLRVLMERGDIDQASFMFTIADESWEWDGQEDSLPIATIREVGELYDVTVTGRGAYPQTDMSVVQGRSARLTNALREGRVQGLSLDDARARGIVKEDPERGPVPGEDDDAAEPVVDERRYTPTQVRAAVELARAITPKE